jgi:hypothetical protein
MGSFDFEEIRMLDQIQDLIRKNLPGEVGDTLRKHLQDAEGWKMALDNAKKVEENRVKQVIDLGRELESLKAQVKAAGDIEKREKEVTQREIKLAVTLAEKRAEAAELALGKIESLAALAFRSPVFVQKEINSIPVPGQNYPNTFTEQKERKTTQE